MNGLSEFLADPEGLLRRLDVKAPEAQLLRRAVVALADGAGGTRTVEDTAALQERVLAAVANGGLSELSRRDLREGCKTFLHPPTPPGRDPEAAGAVIDEVEARRRRAAFLALIGAYIDDFAVGDADIARLGGRLAAALPGWPWRPHEPWPYRAKTYSLFDPDKAPAAIARAVLAADGPATAGLIDAGLDTEGRKRGGLGLAAFIEACVITENGRRGKIEGLQDRLIDWACPRGRGKDLELPAAWPQFAGALFMPWTESLPSPQHQRRISDLAIDFAGDPRTMPPRWRLVEEQRPQAVHTLKRWLVRASVLQFFEIVDSTADERMWRYRRAFWKAFVEAEHVDDAWIVFGAAGAAYARAAADRTEEPALRQFGKLESGGGRGPNHACLLMRIGDLTIAEWSHNGRCYIWRRQDPKPPKLGQTRYQPDQLAHPFTAVEKGQRIGIAHMQAEAYGWQRKVAQTIEEETGARTKTRDWAP